MPREIFSTLFDGFADHKPTKTLNYSGVRRFSAFSRGLLRLLKFQVLLVRITPGTGFALFMSGNAAFIFALFACRGCFFTACFRKGGVGHQDNDGQDSKKDLIGGRKLYVTCAGRAARRCAGGGLRGAAPTGATRSGQLGARRAPAPTTAPGWARASGGPACTTPTTRCATSSSCCSRRASAAVRAGGHSYGGLLTRLYAYAHPRDVAGMVLVDAVGRNMTARQLAIWPDRSNPDTGRRRRSRSPTASTCTRASSSTTGCAGSGPAAGGDRRRRAPRAVRRARHARCSGRWSGSGAHADGARAALERPRAGARAAQRPRGAAARRAAAGRARRGAGGRARGPRARRGSHAARACSRAPRFAASQAESPLWRVRDNRHQKRSHRHGHPRPADHRSGQLRCALERRGAVAGTPLAVPGRHRPCREGAPHDRPRGRDGVLRRADARAVDDRGRVGVRALQARVRRGYGGPRRGGRDVTRCTR